MKQKRAHGLRNLFLVCLALVTLVACGSKLTQENFEKIKTNMTFEEVKSILGEPTETSSAGAVGLSGTQAVWKGKEATLTVHFVNNKVAMKNFSKGR